MADDKSNLREIAERQIQLNHTAYEKLKNELEGNHYGRYALMHDESMIEIYDSREAAYVIGCDRYGLGSFSIEHIGQRPINLGIFTLCVHGNNTGA